MPGSTRTDSNPDQQLKWIDPIGGLGDSLILYSVLHAAQEETGQLFGMIRRWPYSAFFHNHPAVKSFTDSPENVPALKVNYWTYKTPGPGRERVFYLLAEMLDTGLKSKESLWFNLTQSDHDHISHLPLPERFILISTGSNSPRKKWPRGKWEKLITQIRGTTPLPVVQVGTPDDDRINNVIDICGLTRPSHVLAISQKSSLVITVDSFLMHAAAWAKKPSIVMWGPTAPEVFGYESHHNIVSPEKCPETCFGNRKYEIYISECTNNKCMNAISTDEVFEGFKKIMESLK